MRALSVDFGTSNTVAAVAIDGGHPRLVTVDSSPLVPSSIFLTDDGSLATGRDADRQARIDPGRYEPNPKRRVDEGEILLGSAVIPVSRAIAAVLSRIGGEVRRQLGGPPDEVRLTHPARWGQLRRDTLLTAAREAGLGQPGSTPLLIPEPVAAATHFATLSGDGLQPGQALAVYDLGGGTFDVAVVRRTPAGYEVVAEAGLPDLGGLDFDHAIIDHIGRQHVDPADQPSWQQLLMPTDAASRRHQRALMTDVRDAKEALSRYAHTDVALPPPFTDFHLTRTEFEQFIRPNLARSIELLGRTIATAGFAPDQLAGIYLVGGSSRIPLVARLIQEGLSVTPTTLDQPETSVATGALYLSAGSAGAAAHGQLAPDSGPQPAVRPPSQGPLPGQSQGQSQGQSPGQPPYQQPAPRSYSPPPPTQPMHRPPPQQAPAYQPPAPVRATRRTALIAGGLVVLIAAVTVGLVFLLGGVGDNDPNTTTVGPSASGEPADPDEIDEAFQSQKLRDYVRPLDEQIKECRPGADSVPNLGVSDVEMVTCDFTNGYRALFAVTGAESFSFITSTLESTFTSSAAQTGEVQNQTDWEQGKIITFKKEDDNPKQRSVSLYWTKEDDSMLGLLTSPGNDLVTLQSWWEAGLKR